MFNLICVFQMTAQVQTTDTDFLATAKKSQTAAAQAEKLNFLQNTDHSLPFIQQLEFRTETHDFQIREQEFALRFTPNLPKQQRAQESYHQAFIRLIEADEQEILSENLEEKYRLLVDYQFIKNLIADKEALNNLYKKKTKVLRALTSSPDFNIIDFVENEDDIFKAENDILELQQKQNKVNEVLNEIVGTNQLDTDFISIAEVLLAIKSTEKSVFADENKLQLRQNLIQAEYEKERADIYNPIDFVQAKYGGRDDRFVREEFAIGLGIRLPFKGDKKIDLLELEYEQLERKLDYQTDRSEKEKDIKEQARRIENLIAQYQLFEAQTKDNQISYALEKLRKMPDASPLDIVRMEEIMLKKRTQINRLEFRIFQEYVEWLHLSEKTISLPLRNHLSKNQQEF